MRLKMKVNASKLMDKRHAKEISKLSNFILIDIRVLFIVVSVYTTVAAVISTTAHNEATKDTTSERAFNLTDRPEHVDLIVRDVSNAILWNCRQKSVTHSYYKALYSILFAAFVAIMLVFIGARLSVMCGWRYRLGHSLHDILWRLVLVKRVKQLILRYGADDPRTKEKAKIYYDQWNMGSEQAVHWWISAIPYCEAVFLVIAIPFILTSYDIHPLGCLIGPDEDTIHYDNASSKVTLEFPRGLLHYQKIALSSSIFFMVPIGFFAFLLVCKYKTVTRSMGKEIDKVAGRIEPPEDAAPTGLLGQFSFAYDMAKTVIKEGMGGLQEAMGGNGIAMEDLDKKLKSELYDTDSEEITTI